MHTKSLVGTKVNNQVTKKYFGAHAKTSLHSVTLYLLWYFATQDVSMLRISVLCFLRASNPSFKCSDDLF